MSKDRFKAHDEWQDKMMDIIRPYLTDAHVPDIRIMFNNLLFSIDFKTTANVEKNSHDMYFSLRDRGERVAIVYNNRLSERAEDGTTLADWIENIRWRGPLPPSPRSRSGDWYFRMSGGVPLVEFLQSINKEQP